MLTTRLHCLLILMSILCETHIIVEEDYDDVNDTGSRIPLKSNSSKYVDDDDVYDPKRDMLYNNLPEVMKRFYKKYEEEEDCMDSVLRSSPASIELKKNWFFVKIRMPRRTGSVKNTTLVIEFHDVLNNIEALKQNFSIETHSMSDKMLSKYLNTSEVIVNNRLAELYFDITSHYQQMKHMNKNRIRFRFRFINASFNQNFMINGNGNATFSFKTVKSFFLTREENKNCNSYLKDARWISEKLQKSSKIKSMMRSFNRLNEYPVSNNPLKQCSLTDWHVSFHHIGWSSVIIAPNGVNARACTGFCGRHSINATDHAKLQADVSHMVGKKSSVCCVPVSTHPVTLVFYDDRSEDAFVFMHPNIVADGCGCR